MSETGRIKKLTPRQHRAIAALLSCQTAREAAIQAKVAERTLYRWTAKPAFQEELKRFRRELYEQTTNRLIAGREKALDALYELMTSSGQSIAKRMAAANWLDYMEKTVENQELEVRLSKLEAELKP